MKPILRALAAASVCATLSAPAQADSPVITFTMTGAIDQGRDDLKLFLQPDSGPFLGGLPFTLSLTVDTGTLPVTRSTPTETDFQSESASVKGELTVNGKTFAWASGAGSAGIGLTLDDARSSGRQSVLMDTAVSSADGLYVKAGHALYSFFDPIIVSKDSAQGVVLPIRMSGMSATSSFEAQSTGAPPQLTTWFTANVITSAVWTVSPVPEPHQYGMLALGLGAIAFVRRRAAGRMGQGIPVLRTNRIPVRAARSLMRGRPPFGDRQWVGGWAAIRDQRSSGRSSWVMASVRLRTRPLS